MATSNGGFIGVTLDPIFEKITTFTSSGNFTPQVSAGTDEVEVLVVSGGGGGGSRFAGGGGGGGVDTETSLEVAASTSYPVVIGGGGAGGVTSGGSGTSGAGFGTIGTTSSFSGSGITTISTTGGGGGGCGDANDGLKGGSGGGGAGRFATDGGDTSEKSHSITAYADVQHSTTENKIGDSSIKFDGTGDYLRLDDIEVFDLGTGDWTWEMWVWQDAQGNDCWLRFGGADNSNTYGTGNLTQDTSDHDIAFYAGGNVLNLNGSTTTGVNMQEWQHWAMVNDGGDVEVFLNGTSVITSAGANPSLGNAGYREYFIGAWSTTPGFPLDGYLDEIRFSKSARYTSNFTPQTTPFVHDTNTILLIHSDTTNGSTTFTDSCQGTLGQEGYAGGDAPGDATYYQGGGGGGGGAAAADSDDADTAANGAGGIGYSNAISGTATYYAGGGGGGDMDTHTGKSYVASGGTGGGGDGGGSDATVTAEAGTVNTGGGGGGGAYKDGNQAGGAGGSGIVIVKETATGNSGIYNMDDVYAYSIDNKW